MARIALLGAAGTGKRQLAAELAAHLRRRGLGSIDVVIADTDVPRPCDATLLMGLDLPHAHDGAAADALLRALLERQSVAYQVVYGTGAARLQSALLALVSAGVLPAGVADRETDRNPQRAWTWVCEKCSDPACEHRLFQALREERGTAP